MPKKAKKTFLYAPIDAVEEAELATIKQVLETASCKLTVSVVAEIVSLLPTALEMDAKSVAVFFIVFKRDIESDRDLQLGKPGESLCDFRYNVNSVIKNPQQAAAMAAQKIKGITVAEAAEQACEERLAHARQAASFDCRIIRSSKSFT